MDVTATRTILVEPLPVARIDAEISRLYGQAVGAADDLDRELAYVRIDELLEQRFERTHQLSRTIVGDCA